MQDSFFTYFKESIESISMPERFNYPFNFEPHQLCRIAAKELQEYLATQTDWEHDFGIDHYVEGTNIGKMFGVLVVRNAKGEVGYLSAFSGKLAGSNNHKRFVPPIVDLLCENSFYRIGEDEISAINHRIIDLEKAKDYIDCNNQYENDCKIASQELEQCKNDMKLAKHVRDARRIEAQNEFSPEDYSVLLEELKNESVKWHYDFKHLTKLWKERLNESKLKLDVYTNEIAALKEERKTKSANLQQRMFNQYQFLNSKGVYRNVCEIFEQTELKIPPAGAGDCAGPKLLQYAYLHGMQPLVMAEFWWGQSPKSEIRKHGYFYPSCRGKCEPILGHMLQGIIVDENPVIFALQQNVKPQIIYDDETIVIVNKPAEYLSVPGKVEAETVYDFIKNQYPQATGPLIVHRLDMSTSGIMVLAKTEQAYHHLQNQFENRTVKKRYVALLDGIVANDEGIIDLPLRVDLDNRPRQLVCYDYGKPSITKWQVLSRENNRTRIHFFPVTGRTHQLRVHAAHSLGLNCPIVGDDLYGQKANRLHLHAEYLEIVHPVSNEVMRFEVEAGF